MFLQVKKYSIGSFKNILKIYGISQNPDTNDYIMVLQYAKDEQCEKCGNQYTDITYKWCKLCQINEFKTKFTNWSGNKEINYFIQEMQSQFDYSSFLFEWIPYNQFNNIKEIGKGHFTTVFSAIWRNGPLHYNKSKKEWTRESNEVVVLKYLYNSQNISESLNEV